MARFCPRYRDQTMTVEAKAIVPVEIDAAAHAVLRNRGRTSRDGR